MKINKYLLFIGLLFTISVSAQNSGPELKLRNTFVNDHNFTMNITVDLPDVPQAGFIIQLPSGIMATPAAVFLADNELWLKQDKTVPLNKGLIHWSKMENGILFLVANGTLSASRLMLKLQAFMPGNAVDTDWLELRAVQGKVGQDISAGTVISRTKLFQNKNNEIR